MLTPLDLKNHKNLYNNLLKELKRVYNKKGEEMPARNDGIIYLEELSLIQRLDLNFPGYCSMSLNGKSFFSYLTGLKRLTMRQPYLISGDELKSITNKQSLLELEISNSTLQQIDLTEFPNLEDLTITDNESLVSIKGLDSLTKLKYLTFYNNPYVNEKEICTFITEQMTKGCELSLDILLYPQIIHQIRKDYSKYRDSFRAAEWIERIHAGKEIENIKHTTHSIGAIYSSVWDITERILPKSGVSDIEAINLFYRWVRSHVDYDFDALKSNLRMHSDRVTLNFGGKTQEVRLASGKAGGTNSVGNALYSGYAVCEGYTRLLQLFLKSYLIECYALHAHGSEVYDKNAKAPTFEQLARGEVNHSIIQVVTEEGTFYCDTTNEKYDPKTGIVGQECFMKTFEELDTNWYPVRSKKPPHTEPLSPETREQLRNLRMANNAPYDPKKRAEYIMDKFELHLTGEENLEIEYEVKKDQIEDLFLLRIVSKQVRTIIESNLYKEKLDIINSKGTIKR